MILDAAPTTAFKKKRKAGRGTGPLTLAEERMLARRWRQHADARAIELLVHAHLGLVLKIAGEFRYAGPSMEDLVQEGNVGLTIAARRFDPDRSTRLATYASYWIRACMMDHVVRTHGPVRIGTTRAQRRIFFGLGRARRHLERLGRPASSEAVARELGVEMGELDAMTPRLLQRDLSLDSSCRAEEAHSLHETLPHDAPDPEDVYGTEQEGRQRQTQFEGALRKLEPREREIITLRHLREKAETLADLGKRYGLSRERVRQLEARAKDRMRELCSGQRPRRLFRHRPAE